MISGSTVAKPEILVQRQKRKRQNDRTEDRGAREKNSREHGRDADERGE